MITQHLQAVACDVEETLECILSSAPSRLHEAMRYSVLGGGKRFRSYLTWASSQLFDVSPQDVLQTAAAIELIQSYSLVHDDLPCMDNADLRRGKPSCHKRFGEATAILVGDALIPLAFQTLASLDVATKVRLELIDGLAQTIGSLGLAAGQMMDLGQEGLHYTLETLLEQQRLKTGVLFGFATEAGAILGGASIEKRQALKSYGLLFGKAFQMKDDWLDACGNEQIIGKPCHQDVDKFTFLNFLSPELLEETVASTLQEAIKTLSSFGKRGTLLKEFAIFSLCEEK
ncbi:MAG: polyprenyl synthetase family protein [Alphaproteobacteria bacterium]|nr:polyprenyl synthetase family protein [Alphaproteobacteria bacterium]